MLWLVALILGWLLVEGQPSAGGSWSNPYFLSLETAHSAWGFLLLGLAICLWGAGKRALGWGFVLWLALGTWLPTLLMDAPFFRIGPVVATFLMILMGAVLLFRRKLEPESEGLRGGAAEVGALVLGGVGMALGLHGLARILARMGDSGPAGTSVTLATLVTLLGLGSFAFGRILPVDFEKRKGWLGLIWMALMFGIAAALRAEQTLGTNRGLRSLMRRFQLDLSYAGTIPGEVLTSVSVLILPALAVGTLVLALRGAQRVALVVLGAGLGTLLVPFVLSASALPWTELQPSVRLVVWGMALLTPIGPLAWWMRGRKSSAGVALLIAITLVAYLPKDSILVPKPWQRTLVEPVWQMETAQGQLTVTSDSRGSYQALLDQVPLTADGEHARLHDRCMVLSMGWRNGYEYNSEPRILLIGVLTPQIATRLRELGASKIDRLTPFDADVARACETALAGGREFSEDLGDRVNAQQAEIRIRGGEYSLVLGLPSTKLGARIASRLPMSKVATPAIWYSLEDLPSTGNVDQTGVVCSDGLGRFAFARTHFEGDKDASSTGFKRATLGEGEMSISRLRWGLLRPWDRTPKAVACHLDSLSQAADANDALLFQSLRDLASAQKASSPFETEFQGFELPREPMERLLQALKAGPSSGFNREIAGGLARTLVGKRDVGTIMELLPGLSQSMGEPYELERSIARAELESLEPAAAATRLLRLRAAWPQEMGLLEDLGIALDQSEQPARAVEVWNALQVLHPGEWAYQKAWTLSLFRAGDARAPAALRSALASHPEDPELLAVSQSGPLPQVEKGFQPKTSRHQGHEDGE